MIAIQSVMVNNNNNQNVIVVQPPQPIPPNKQDDSGWILLVVLGLVGFLAYLYALSPELFTDLFLMAK